MTYLDAIILHCLKQINGERTGNSVFHLLNGKRSSQTIQDAHLYHLSFLFETASYLTREQFENRITVMKNQGWVDNQTDGIYKITNDGKGALNTYWELHDFPLHIKGWELQKISDIFWKRLTLFIQVVSHHLHENKQYFPIQRDNEIQHWIKQYLHKNPLPIDRLSSYLYGELQKILANTQFPIDPNFIVTRFSGVQYIGLTIPQCVEAFRVEEFEYRYLFQNGMHYLLQSIMDHEQSYPILYSIMADLLAPISLTESTRKTYQGLKNGLTKEEISLNRGLKLATIEDHIIEITLNDNKFSIDPFISKEEAFSVVKKSKQLSQKRLKPLKEQFPHLSYFQIRLALAKGVER
ncbi:helix-turn-helix domain-containing protein [Bacillus spongiae]|uniref:Helix-turn-helix domain-containing protein n=1 Tax=Bacillus spongiae TaxID=2683610 RepID=A0ABU8HDL5_9BACI